MKKRIIKSDLNKGRMELIIIGIIIIIIMICLAIAGLNDSRPNPDKDVCKVMEYKWDDGESITCKEDINCVAIEDRNPLNLTSNKCLLWRPKTKCELDPKTEGCICDEFEIMLNNTYEGIVNSAKVLLPNWDISFVFYEDKGLNYTNVLYKKCIKSHESICKEVCE